MEAKDKRAVTSRSLRDYGRPLDVVTSIIYLGRVILAAGDDWPEVIRKLAEGAGGVEGGYEDP